MKEKITIKNNIHWLLLFLLLALFFMFVIWISIPYGAGDLVLIIVLFTVLGFAAGHAISDRREKKQIALLQSFLRTLDEQTEKQLLASLNESWHPSVILMSEILREKTDLARDKEMDLQNYQDFIEGWTHEIKTPLALKTLVLANHKEEMSPYVYKRMEHVRFAISNDVERILYHARLRAEHVDYTFHHVDVAEVVEESITDFIGIAEEKKIAIDIRLETGIVLTDAKVVNFILTQILSNAFKYARVEDGVVKVRTWKDAHADGAIHLLVRDNGNGVPEEDVPFIFDKGFTGNQPERKNATGMGLYLVKKYAERLSINVRVDRSDAQEAGFGIELIFPAV